MPTSLSFSRYLDSIAASSGRFAAVLDGIDPAAPVPTCPGWTCSDLVWHLAEVQWFWTQIITGRPLDPDAALTDELTRPADAAGLADLGRSSSADLVAALAEAAPDEPAWSWYDADQTVGFSYRRQAHEALIHRLDAELAAGVRSPLDPELSTDGVDEALRVMYGGAPPWAAYFVQEGDRIRVTTTDTSGSWLVRLARFVGDHEGRHYDEGTIDVAPDDDGEPVAATIRGAAADVDCWLWRRPTVGPVDRAGDPQVLDRFDEVISTGIQ